MKIVFDKYLLDGDSLEATACGMFFGISIAFLLFGHYRNSFSFLLLSAFSVLIPETVKFVGSGKQV
jgi:hypothetical protein